MLGRTVSEVVIEVVSGVVIMIVIMTMIAGIGRLRTGVGERRRGRGAVPVVSVVEMMMMMITRVRGNGTGLKLESGMVTGHGLPRGRRLVHAIVRHVALHSRRHFAVACRLLLDAGQELRAS